MHVVHSLMGIGCSTSSYHRSTVASEITIEIQLSAYSSWRSDMVVFLTEQRASASY